MASIRRRRKLNADGAPTRPRLPAATPSPTVALCLGVASAVLFLATAVSNLACAETDHLAVLLVVR